MMATLPVPANVTDEAAEANHLLSAQRQPRSQLGL